jgi:protein-S-isoprenylcysteine O-methyltransferase Ste14
MVGLSAILLFLGARRYDAGQFTGFKQIREGTSIKAITHAGKLDTSDILSVTRHPWYLASIIIIWARPLDISAILINVILTCYLITGTCLEERKLVREFGDQYRDYQKRVSMLIPFRALRSHSMKKLSDKEGSR